MPRETNRGSAKANRPAEKALAGLRVLDIATYIAAPFCATLMAEFGAEVIKVEMPGSGDPLRRLGEEYRGLGLMWAQEARNKKGITCDMHQPKGQEIIKKLVKHCDFVVENFRPGTLEEWNLGYEELRAVNPGIIMVRISAYGQTGPYCKKAGFGRIAQAFGGFTYLAGYPNLPPVNPGTPTIADYAAGLFAAFAALAAKQYRDRTGRGQCIDISLYESMFRLLDNLAFAYHTLGLVRERVGSAAAHSAPHSHFPTQDGKWVAIACTNDRMFQRLTKAMGREELTVDPRYDTNAKRVARRPEVEALVSEWTKTYPMRELVDLLDAEEVPVSPIYSIADIFQDPHYRERGTIIEVDDPTLGKVKMPGIVPRMSLTPGAVEHLGPTLGQHNEEICGGLLGYSPQELAALRQEGII